MVAVPCPLSFAGATGASCDLTMALVSVGFALGLAGAAHIATSHHLHRGVVRSHPLFRADLNGVVLCGGLSLDVPPCAPGRWRTSADGFGRKS